MPQKNIAFFLVFSVLLFTAAVILFWYSHSLSTLRPIDSDFSVDRSLEVTGIEIKHESTGVHLTKDSHGQWILDGQFLANDPAVRQLVSVMNRIRVRQPVSVANRADVHKYMDDEGVRVRIWVQAWRIHLGTFRILPFTRLHQSFRVGEDTPDGLSTYMRKDGSDFPFKIHLPASEGGLRYLFDPHQRAWRDPMVVNLERENVSRVEVKVTGQPAESFVLHQKEDGRFSFHHVAESEPLMDVHADTSRVVRFLSSFRDLHYESLLNEQQEEQRKKLMIEQPFMEITVESTEGMRTTMVAYARKAPEEDILTPATGNDPNRFYLKVNEGEFALAQYYVFNRILRPLSFFEN